MASDCVCLPVNGFITRILLLFKSAINNIPVVGSTSIPDGVLNKALVPKPSVVPDLV
jgi:hypothetical protein